uniref:Uncharacterized protein n=1 Tax=Romanomermis culicivorax TaxID=13658 RepID=A0A915JCE4_ROMCU
MKKKPLELRAVANSSCRNMSFTSCRHQWLAHHEIFLFRVSILFNCSLSSLKITIRNFEEFDDRNLQPLNNANCLLMRKRLNMKYFLRPDALSMVIEKRQSHDSKYIIYYVGLLEDTFCWGRVLLGNE